MKQTTSVLSRGVSCQVASLIPGKMMTRRSLKNLQSVVAEQAKNRIIYKRTAIEEIPCKLDGQEEHKNSFMSCLGLVPPQQPQNLETVGNINQVASVVESHEEVNVGRKKIVEKRSITKPLRVSKSKKAKKTTEQMVPLLTPFIENKENTAAQVNTANLHSTKGGVTEKIDTQEEAYAKPWRFNRFLKATRPSQKNVLLPSASIFCFNFTKENQNRN